MFLERLEVERVRNLERIGIELSTGFNLFVGPNGSGKTALLEAVHLLLRGRSFRTPRIGSVVRHGVPDLLLRGTLQDEHRGRLELALRKRRRGPTELHVNRTPGRRLSEVAAVAPLQVMLPDASHLVLGPPQGRRQLLDWGTFHVKPGYLDLLRHYQRALRQRNHLLRQMAGRPSHVGDDLDTWTHELAVLGEQVGDHRRAFIDALRPVFEAVLSDLAPGMAVELRYGRGYPGQSGLANSLAESLPRDVKLASTHSGPHRADLELRHAGHAAAGVLSRGQAKMTAAALRLAQARLVTSDSGRRSLFLIDDLDAELDVAHGRRFYELLARTGSQILATATERGDIEAVLGNESTQVFHVEHGRCQPADDGH